jgi:hypothetical protein
MVSKKTWFYHTGYINSQNTQLLWLARKLGFIILDILTPRTIDICHRHFILFNEVTMLDAKVGVWCSMSATRTTGPILSDHRLTSSRDCITLTVVGLVWSNETWSYAGGSVASGRASHARLDHDEDSD